MIPASGNSLLPFANQNHSRCDFSASAQPVSTTLIGNLLFAGASTMQWSSFAFRCLALLCLTGLAVFAIEHGWNFLTLVSIDGTLVVALFKAAGGR
jgi:hypothetical protein